MQPQAKIANETQTIWSIDPTHTTVEFAVKNFFMFTVKGSVNEVAGQIKLDGADIRRSSVTVVLQAASIDTHNKKRDTHLRAADFLEAERFPEIRFESTKVEPGVDRDTLRVTGSLTIKDRKKEIILDVSDIDRSRSPSGEHVAYYTALVELNRHDFGLDYMRGLIGRALKVMINVQATRRV
jgi:polyisoprenoid-binding protein YceI